MHPMHFIAKMSTKALFAILTVVFLAAITLGEGNGRIYSITVGRNYGAQYYGNDDGMLIGYVPELISEVCKEAGINCVTTRRSSNGRCWLSSRGMHPSGGPGLHGREYDGCSARDVTIERIHTFSFTLPYTRRVESIFFFLKGKNFNWRDLAGKKIGFYIGWSSNEQCLARANHIANNVLKLEQIFHFPRTSTEDYLKNGTVDAVFADTYAFSTEERETIGLDWSRGLNINCFLGGNSIMARKDSDFPARWNVGFRKLVNSGRYQKLCEEANAKHGHRGDVNCVEA